MKVGNFRDKRRYDSPAQNYVYVGRPSPLGNPFYIGRDGTREEVIEKYRGWLANAIQSNEHVRRVFWTLVDHELYDENTTVLLCFCHPLPCHADVILEFVKKEVELITANTEENTNGPRDADRDPQDTEG